MEVRGAWCVVGGDGWCEGFLGVESYVKRSWRERFGRVGGWLGELW